MSNGDLPLDIFRVAGSIITNNTEKKEKHLNGEFSIPKIKNNLPERFRLREAPRR